LALPFKSALTMNPVYRTFVSLLATIAWYQLACPAVNPATLPVASSIFPKTFLARATGDLLSAEQKARLSKLKIPIVLPTYLPQNFRVTDFDAGKEEMANESYSYYSIIYKGANNTCLELTANTDPGMTTSGLNTTSMTTALGKVTVSSGNLENKPIIIGLFSLPRNSNNGYMLRTGGWVPGRRCATIGKDEYLQVLKSLRIINAEVLNVKI
jgi:hypothetical protein